jgi:hypothetical protein
MTGSHRTTHDSRPRRQLDVVTNVVLRAPLVRALRMPYFGRLSVILSLVALLVLVALIARTALA